MDIERLLVEVKEGRIDVNEALRYLQELPFKELGFAKIDNHRQIRQSHPEVIFCQGKTPEQVRDIIAYMSGKTKNILASRATEAHFQAVQEICPEAEYDRAGRMIVVKRDVKVTGKGTILVLTAGTADIPVAEEAVVTAELMGNKVEKIYDVGVAGIHRLFAHLDKLRQANVIIVCAGMEGALASVVGGLVNRPVIAVPTSIGYGASFNGLAALLTMLNSCAAGIAVVNIDNGFGAGRLASIINHDNEVEV